MTLFKPDALAGKNAFISGGTSGINLAIAAAFAAHGARVTVIGRDAARAEAAEASLKVLGEANAISADVRNYAAVQAAIAGAVAAFGPLDVVVAGAAGNFLAPAEAMSSNAFRTVIEIDLVGSFNVYRAAFEHLRLPGASLISITAPQADAPIPFQAHACAAKAGVNMLTKALALEWGAHGVRVNALSPGPIADTEGFERLVPAGPGRAAYARRIALQRFGTCSDIAGAAVFLASDASAYVSGEILACDGGAVLGDASQGADLSKVARA